MEGLLIGMGYGKILFEFFRYTKEGWRAVVFKLPIFEVLQSLIIKYPSR